MKEEFRRQRGSIRFRQRSHGWQQLHGTQSQPKTFKGTDQYQFLQASPVPAGEPNTQRSFGEQ